MSVVSNDWKFMHIIYMLLQIHGVAKRDKTWQEILDNIWLCNYNNYRK